MFARTVSPQPLCVNTLRSTAVLMIVLAIVAGATPLKRSVQAHAIGLESLRHDRLQRIPLAPLAFTRNDGQWKAEVLYQARGQGILMWFTKQGVCYQIQRRADDERARRLLDRREQELPGLETAPCGLIESRVIVATLVGSNKNPRVTAEGEMTYKCNWFIGNDPAKWHTDVPNYSSIVYMNVYPGIDIRYRGNGEQIEHDFIVAPGADPSLIELCYDGAQSIEIDRDGNLIILTDFGELVERIPRTYQERDGQLEPVSCCYEITDEKSIRYVLDESHDQALTLVIDPVLEYSTYLGGSLDEYGLDITVDDLGSAYVTGPTYSSDFPTQNAYDASLNSGPGYPDAFVTKLSPSGDTLIYSTYVGGSSTDNSVDIAVDDSGCAYITGNVQSSNYPTLNAFDASFNGGANWNMDAFVTKLSAAGNALVYSTFLGGGQGVGDDYGYAIAVDDSGQAYVTGRTPSTDFPTQNALDGTLDGNVEMDAFVTKFSAAGHSLIYSTYLGGSLHDYGYGIAADEPGNAYVVGITSSSDFPTQNAYDAVLNGNDAFITKISPAGDSFVFSTFLGGSGNEEGNAIAVDASGHTYVTGSCGSTFPTVNAFDGSYGGGGDAFITKFSIAGNALEYSTFLGGTLSDQGLDIAVDSARNVYVSGQTKSSNFPTLNSYDDSKFGDVTTYNGFITKLRATGDSLRYSTYIGGGGWSIPSGITVDDEGSVYFVGAAGPTGLPVINSYDSTYNGGGDGYVVKLPTPVCHADPRCDGRTDVLDVVGVINVAFRAVPNMVDDNCVIPREDLDCNGAIDIIDVIKMVNVAFRAANAATEFCHPCS